MKKIKMLSAVLVTGLLAVMTACGKSEGNPKEDGGVLHIKTAKDMLAFAERVNNGEKTLHVVLKKDIDMSSVCSESAGSWTAIKEFDGEFDGQEHAIRNLYSVQADKSALFNSLDGNVKNLRLENVVMESTEDSAAGIAITLSGEIENCSISGSVKGYKYAGGIAADIYSESIVTDCINEADICGGYYNGEKHRLDGAAAGVAACLREGLGIQITGCVNRGTVTGNGNMSGGIAGHCKKGKILIENCRNEGNVQGRKGVYELGSWEMNENYTGGIVGYAGESTLVTKCINDGNISGTGRVGGIAGESGYVIINAANHGELETTEGGQVYGITCAARKGLLNCYNTGNMTCDQNACALGYAPNAIEVNLYNFGMVTCTSDSGVLTDGFPWSMGGAVRGLLNTYSRENCIVVPDSFQDVSPSRIQAGNATPDAAFTDGTILNALNEAAADINGDMTMDYQGPGGYIEKLKEDERFELSAWKAGSNGFPCFEWE